MARHEVQAITESTVGFQMRWPQMMYLTLSVTRLFMAHSASTCPEMVGTYRPPTFVRFAPTMMGKGGRTPPPSEHIKSIALPQQ